MKVFIAVQSCLTLCDPRLVSPWNSSGKNTGVEPFPSPRFFSMFQI